MCGVASQFHGCRPAVPPSGPGPVLGRVYPACDGHHWGICSLLPGPGARWQHVAFSLCPVPSTACSGGSDRGNGGDHCDVRTAQTRGCVRNAPWTPAAARCHCPLLPHSCPRPTGQHRPRRATPPPLPRPAAVMPLALKRLPPPPGLSSGSSDTRSSEALRLSSLRVGHWGALCPRGAGSELGGSRLSHACRRDGPWPGPGAGSPECRLLPCLQGDAGSLAGTWGETACGDAGMWPPPMAWVCIPPGARLPATPARKGLSGPAEAAPCRRRLFAERFLSGGIWNHSSHLWETLTSSQP